MKGLGPAQALSHRRVANRSQANPDSYDYEMRPVGPTGVVRPVNVQTGARLDEVQNNGHNIHSQTSRNPAHLKQTPNFRWEQVGMLILSTNQNLHLDFKSINDLCQKYLKHACLGNSGPTLVMWNTS